MSTLRIRFRYCYKWSIFSNGWLLLEYNLGNFLSEIVTSTLHLALESYNCAVFGGLYGTTNNQPTWSCLLSATPCMMQSIAWIGNHGLLGEVSRLSVGTLGSWNYPWSNSVIMLQCVALWNWQVIIWLCKLLQDFLFPLFTLLPSVSFPGNVRRLWPRIRPEKVTPTASTSLEVPTHTDKETFKVPNVQGAIMFRARGSVGRLQQFWLWVWLDYISVHPWLDTCESKDYTFNRANSAPHHFNCWGVPMFEQIKY